METQLMTKKYTTMSAIVIGPLQNSGEVFEDQDVQVQTKLLVNKAAVLCSSHSVNGAGTLNSKNIKALDFCKQTCC